MIGQDSECKKCLLRPFGRSAKSSRVNFAKSLILHGWMQSWYPMRRNSRSALLALKKHQDRWDLKGCCDHPAVVSSRNLFLPIICSLAKIVQQRASFSCQLLKSWNIIRITIVIRNMCLRGQDLLAILWPPRTVISMTSEVEWEANFEYIDATCKVSTS